MNRPTTRAAALERGGVGGWKRVLLGVVIAMAVLLLIAAPFLRYGSVVGEEFSPDRFRRRSYHYWEIPLLHVQVTPLKKQDETNDLEKYLVQNKLILVANQPRPRWDLVALRRAEVPAPPRDAEILCRYLDLTNSEGELVWLQWTKNEPQRAKVLWPAVAEAARRDVYVVMPDLFHMAEKADDAAQLKQRIARHLATRFARLADVHQQLNRHDRALQLYAAALSYDAKSDRALAGQAKSLRAQGKAAPEDASPNS